MTTAPVVEVLEEAAKKLAIELARLASVSMIAEAVQAGENALYYFGGNLIIFF